MQLYFKVEGIMPPQEHYWYHGACWHCGASSLLAPRYCLGVRDR